MKAPLFIGALDLSDLDFDLRTQLGCHLYFQEVPPVIFRDLALLLKIEYDYWSGGQGGTPVYMQLPKRKLLKVSVFFRGEERVRPVNKLLLTFSVYRFYFTKQAFPKMRPMFAEDF